MDEKTLSGAYPTFIWGLFFMQGFGEGDGF
ncbi:hypothetical protein F939_02646 [Acinetobacter radioresistens DSM 6976 = NBRC 102413 = CIP 103788]|jgi:hypothetical protein|nr:hypothetical protein F939_02646 [Acinetobacter radioresistens DSM 6976 = NBRC 102413 = CIP 103788]